jgi:glycosyl transferase family 1
MWSRARARPQDGTRLVTGTGGNVLLLSLRRIAQNVAFCQQYEFEDVVGEVTGADRVEVGDRAALELSRRAHKLARLVTGSRSFAATFAPSPSTVSLERDYELFFPVFNNTFELFALATVPDWRKRCRVAACYISEVWAHRLPRQLLELLSDFDHVFVGQSHPVDEVAKIVGRPCSYLPLAVDVLRFTPLPNAPSRTIDVSNIGRRSHVTHDALVRLAREREIFYYYDTVAAHRVDRQLRSFPVDNASEHRLLLASLLQRTRYFIANRALVNRPEFTMGREEISGRFYEGAAAGTIMLGEAPRTEEFARQFGWPDAVIHLPFDSGDIGRTLLELDRDPQRVATIRRDNVRGTALRHDWVHRLRTVFETLGIAPTDAMLRRDMSLRALGAMALGTAAGEDQPSLAEVSFAG